MTFNRDRVALDALDTRLTQIARRLLPGATGAAEGNSVTLKALFADDSERTERLSLSVGELHLDYSKSLIDSEGLAALTKLAEASGMQGAISALFRGAKINQSEGRAALHTSLRSPESANAPHSALVSETLASLREFVDRVHSGEWTGYSGQTIDTVVNLGIGGSDLGPAMVVDALADFALNRPRVRFVSNVDPAHLARTLKGLDPATTLFIIASKTFGTLETLANARAARDWLVAASDEAAVARHFVAVSANIQAASDFGIEASNIFPLWDWVGGRFSLWSAIGLPIALGIGFEAFEELLGGAYAMDRHFETAPLGENLPVVSALLAFWYRQYGASPSTAVVPYSQDLSLFPAYLQQLYMESLGKSMSREGAALPFKTSEIIWGSAGTNGQHSYFQQLHQGTEFTPVEFIACATASVDGGDERHRQLLANCLSQSMALMNGDETSADVGADNWEPQKTIAGNRPSTTLLLKQLTPQNLGALIALYEHKVFALSVLWNINAFDQWGVELGKRLSKEVYAALSESAGSLSNQENIEAAASVESASTLDASTRALVQKISSWNTPR